MDGKAGKLTDTDPDGMTGISGGFTAGAALSFALMEFGTGAAGCSDCLAGLPGMLEGVSGGEDLGTPTTAGAGGGAITRSAELVPSSRLFPAFKAEISDGRCGTRSGGFALRAATAGLVAFRFGGWGCSIGLGIGGAVGAALEGRVSVLDAGGAVCLGASAVDSVVTVRVNAVMSPTRWRAANQPMTKDRTAATATGATNARQD